jgi:nucleoside-diphosphate-sugar epimerase
MFTPSDEAFLTYLINLLHPGGHMLIVGCGAVGRRLAEKLRAAGQPVSATSRDAANLARLAERGISTFRLDLDQHPLPAFSTTHTGVFYLVPPPPKGRSDTRFQRFLDACAQRGQPARIVLISTTGVYGDCAGAWVDESWPARPTTDRARRRWDAERQLHAWRRRTGGAGVVLRVAGIYGPGRLPLERLRRREPLLREADAPWTNRIYIDDLVSTCEAAMTRGRDGEVYNACDGNPSNMTAYFKQVADAAGLPRPPEIDWVQAQAALSPGMLGYLGESRRLTNTKLRNELGVCLRYPNLAAGLAAALRGSDAEAATTR